MRFYYKSYDSRKQESLAARDLSFLNPQLPPLPTLMLCYCGKQILFNSWLLLLNRYLVEKLVEVYFTMLLLILLILRLQKNCICLLL